MATFVVVADLLDLRREFDLIGPKRDRRSDGTIGDAAHRKESSDHNADDTPGVVTPYTDADRIPEVHALDVDSSGPWLPKWNMGRAVSIVVDRHHLGALDVLQNVIYNRTIWSRSWGWTPRPYTLSDPHIEHAHFSSRYGSGAGASNPENYVGSWGIADALTAEQEGGDMPTVSQIWDAAWGKGTRRKTAGQLLVATAANAEAALAEAQKNSAAIAELKALLTKTPAPR